MKLSLVFLICMPVYKNLVWPYYGKEYDWEHLNKAIASNNSWLIFNTGF